MLAKSDFSISGKSGKSKSTVRPQFKMSAATVQGYENCHEREIITTILVAISDARFSDRKPYIISPFHEYVDSMEYSFGRNGRL